MRWVIGFQRLWWRFYFHGRISSGAEQRIIENALIGKLASPDFWLTKWRECFSARLYCEMFKIQFVQPTRLAVRDESRFFFLTTGFILSGNHSWHETTRVRWLSQSPFLQSHWTQLSPRPIFGILLAPTEAEYIGRVTDWATLHSTTFTTALGDDFTGVVRSHDGGYYAINGFSVNVSAGRQKTRRPPEGSNEFV